MIRVVCPSCGSKLSAKDKHAGRTKPCPKCGQPIFVPVPDGVESLPQIPVEEPDSSQFGLVGNKQETPAEGMKLKGITAYKLPLRWALPAIAESDDAICAKIAGYGTLSKEVKGVIRLALKEHFMYEIWEGATKVLEFLNSPDAHTHGVENS
jgi:hypothetical protein